LSRSSWQYSRQKKKSNSLSAHCHLPYSEL
jgi:hypothetical protein